MTTGANEADRGLLATVRELTLARDAPPTSATVAAAVGVPHEYTSFIERRLEQNLERGFVEQTSGGCWTLTPTGTAAAGIRWATPQPARG